MTVVTSPPITRRKSIQLLLGFAVVATMGGIIAPIVAYLIPRETVTSYGGPTDIGPVADFPLNGYKVVSVGDRPVIVVNTKTGGLKAFSAICTHLGCIVSWNERKSIIQCPCHDGFFNASTGAVISGPPPRPIASYELAVKDGRVLVGEPRGAVYGS